MTSDNAGLQWLAIHLAVGNLERSIRFYCDGLGFKLMHEFGEQVAEEGNILSQTLELPFARYASCILARNDMALELIEFREPATIAETPRKPVNRVGPGLMLFNAPDASVVARRLVELGGEIVYDGGTGDGAFSAYIVTDPDGARIQVVSLPPQAAGATFRT